MVAAVVVVTLLVLQFPQMILIGGGEFGLNDRLLGQLLLDWHKCHLFLQSYKYQAISTSKVWHSRGGKGCCHFSKELSILKRQCRLLLDLLVCNIQLRGN